jgi:hypothetical protein
MARRKRPSTRPPERTPYHRAGERLLRRLCTGPLHPGARVWRYMDFMKFVCMLEERALFFCRLSVLGDPYEGLYAPANITHRRRQAALLPGTPNERFLRRGVLRHLDRTTVVSSWHLSAHESAAMWKLYAATNGSICIQSTYARLRACMPDVDLCRVRYIDYRSQPVPESHLALPLLHKRRSFQHEHELRAFMLLSLRSYPSTREAEGGYWRSVDLERLTQRVTSRRRRRRGRQR